jgi:antitoxin (DNA-binding transcriptional repressor) of toxin-antitoxin stability system
MLKHALGFFYVLPDARNLEHLSAIRDDRPRTAHPNYLEAIRRGERPNVTDGDRHTFGIVMLSKYRRARESGQASASTPWTPEEFAEMWVDEYFAARREIDPSFVETPTACVGDGSQEASEVT